MTLPTILALDFDGVLCNGLQEYFQTAWRAYGILMGADPPLPPDLAERFYPLRAVVETGWEMPLLLYGLCQGVEDEAILARWGDIVPELLETTGWTATQIMAAVDGVRDRWIATDLPSWLALHRFYPGVLDWVQQAQAMDIYPVIISTKEGRFIAQLLQQQGLALAPEQIMGKEVKRPKGETLGQLLTNPPGGSIAPASIWFIEDRYQTLEKVAAYPDLGNVALFLADWGYNTPRDRAAARHNDRVTVLSLQHLPPWAQG